MSVLNLEKTADAIAKFIKEEIETAGAVSAVVGLSGGADSALVALLCKRSGVPTYCVLMPCGSSRSSVERALELAQLHGLETLTVNLQTAFESVSNQVNDHTFPDRGVPETASKGALRSCLRAPTLDYVGKITKGLIVGTGNRDEDEVTRYFQKRGDGCVDISPIARLHKSEVYELLRFLKCPLSIIDAVPSADLWGPESGQADEKELGLSYGEVEWGVRTLNDGPFVHERHLENFSARQQEVLQKLEQMEKSSRHKAEPPRVFDVRAIPGLVK